MQELREFDDIGEIEESMGKTVGIKIQADTGVKEVKIPIAPFKL